MLKITLLVKFGNSISPEMRFSRAGERCRNRETWEEVSQDTYSQLVSARAARLRLVFPGQRPLVSFQRSDIHRLTCRAMQIPDMKEMLDRCRIRATCFQRSLNRFPQTGPVILFSQLEKVDHPPRARLLAVPFHQGLPDHVEARWPSPALRCCSSGRDPANAPGLRDSTSR